MRVVGAAALVVAVTACGAGVPAGPRAASPGTQPSTGPGPARSDSASAAPSPAASSSRSPGTLRVSDRPILGGAPPSWLGRRVLPLTASGYGQVRPTPPELAQRRFTLPDVLAPLPGRGFAVRVRTPAPAAVIARSTWTRSCPVKASELSWVRLTFRGFDQQRHTGELLVRTSATEPLVKVFRRLYAARFPLEEMRIIRAEEQDAPPTGDGNNTSAFNCRPTTGGSEYSQHAYGLAIDLNPFQNPYVRGGLVLPELASAYRDRTWSRPGMITARGPVVRAFTAIGWTWGGSWRSLVDYQHFSQNGR